MAADDVRIVVASHRPYWMPTDPMYLPVQVGAAGKETIEGFQRDDVATNISQLNPHYCELTALYWAWKNLEADYLGLAHYRRHFKGGGQRQTLTLDEARSYVKRAPVVMPTKRRYYIETVESHYGHTFDARHIVYLREAIAENTPEYLRTFNEHMGMRQAHIYNMTIMRRDLLDEYLSWMFGILRKVDACIDYSELDDFGARAVGRASERLIDTWLDYNHVPYVECRLVSMERTNWVKKGGSFLLAKFAGRKYTKSF